MKKNLFTTIIIIFCFIKSLPAQLPVFKADVKLPESHQEGNGAFLPPGEGANDYNKVALYVDYSYLTGGSQGDNLSFPVGGHIAFEYMIRKNFGLVLDGSYHTKKEKDEQIARAFIMGGIQTMLVRAQQKKQRELLLFARLMAGMATDRSKITFGATYKDTYNAVAIAAGLGLAYPIGSSLFLTLIPDYIYTHFNDESQSNFRFGMGVKIAI